MPTVPPRVLIHVEDPGALNFLIDLPLALEAHGIDVDLLADGFAAAALATHDANRFLRHETPATIFAERDPDFVITGTSENRSSRAFDIIALAREKHVPSAAIVDLPVNAAARFAGTTADPFAFAPDIVWCADDATLDAFVALGLPHDRLERVRNPRLAALRARAQLDELERSSLRRRLFPAWNGEPIVVFAAEPPSALDARQSHDDAHYTLHGTSGSTWRTQIALDELLLATEHLDTKPYVVVRLHPKNKPGDFAASRAHIDQLHAGGDPADVLAAADIVVGLTSMILQEAASMGTRVLAIVPRDVERAWLPMIADGTIPSVTTRAALEHALPERLAAPPPAPSADNAPALIDALIVRLP